MEASSRTALLTAAVVVCTALLRVAGPVQLPGTAVLLVPTIGIAFAAGLTQGDRGASAAAVGVGVGGLALELGSVLHVGSMVATLVYGLLVPRAWGAVSTLRADRTPAPHSVAAVPVYVVVAMVASLPAACAAASVQSVVAGVPFFLTAPGAWIEFTVSGVGIGGLSVLILCSVLQRTDQDESIDLPSVEDHRETTWIVVLSTGWLAVGSAIDVAFSLARIVPASYYSSRFGISVSVAWFNRLQVAGQLLLLLAVVAALWRAGVGRNRDVSGESATGRAVRYVRSEIGTWVRKR